MGDRWGDMKVCVMDWSHDTCSTWQSESDQLTLRCVDTCPRVLGDVTHVGSWRGTVTRGRELGGDWLDPPVEQRAGLRFSGYDLIKAQLRFYTHPSVHIVFLITWDELVSVSKYS